MGAQSFVIETPPVIITSLVIESHLVWVLLSMTTESCQTDVWRVHSKNDNSTLHVLRVHLLHTTQPDVNNSCLGTENQRAAWWNFLSNFRASHSVHLRKYAFKLNLERGLYNLPKPKQEYECSAATLVPGLPTVHAVSLMVCEIAIKNCTVRELSNLAYLLLRWSNRGEFLGVGRRRGVSLQLVIIEG